MPAQMRWMMRYKVFKLTENRADEDVSGDDGVFDMRETNSKMCITRMLGRNVFGDVNRLSATVARDNKTLMTNLKLAVFLKGNLRLDTEGSERTKAR